MRLFSYARKVLILAHEANLADQPEVVTWTVGSTSVSARLGRIPALRCC